jgi:hypothetical protein
VGIWVSSENITPVGVGVALVEVRELGVTLCLTVWGAVASIDCPGGGTVCMGSEQKHLFGGATICVLPELSTLVNVVGGQWGLPELSSLVSVVGGHLCPTRTVLPGQCSRRTLVSCQNCPPWSM